MKRKTQYTPRKRTEQKGNTATLFPFLAVLLCTMGALIMLLVLITRNVQEGNAQEITQEPAMTLPTGDTIPSLSSEKAAEILSRMNDGIEEIKWFRENFETSKKEAVEELSDAKTRLAILEKVTQKVHNEIERLTYLEQELGKADKIKDSELKGLKNQLEQRKQVFKQETLELAELQKKLAEDAKSYSIIPYQGKSGTFRRPIYIECRDNRVIIQPEGVELIEADFQLSSRPDNPFDSVLRVIRQYYIETEQIVRGTEPYPLLIVRPSGIDAYGAVRQSIGTWVQDYGYELVNEDWKVKYSVPSAELKERIEKQLEMSRNRMAGYLAAVRAAEAAGEIKRQQRQYRLNPQGQVQAIDGEAPMLSRQYSGRYGKTNDSGGTDAVPQKNAAASGNAGTVDPNISLSTEEQNNHASGGVMPLPQTLPGLTGNGGIPPMYKTDSASGFASPQTVNSLSTATPFPSGSNVITEENGQAVRQIEQADGTSKPQTLQSSAVGNAKNTEPPQNVSAGGQTMIPAVTVSPAVSEYGQPGVAATWSPGLDKKNNNWALKEVKPFSAAVSRTVKIQCEADKFILLPQPGLYGVRVIPFTGSTVDAADKLVYAVWDFMESWGIAGEKMYWRPVLQIKVLSGGEQRFNELKQLLYNSGLAVEEVK